MFASLASFAVLCYQLSVINGITWVIGDYPFPSKTQAAPAFSIHDNIAYIFEQSYKPDGTATIYKLDTTITNPSWQSLPVKMPWKGPWTFSIQGDASAKVGKLFYFYQHIEMMFYIFDTTTETFLDNTNIARPQAASGADASLLTDNNNYIYVVGGQADIYGQYIQQYDINNNVWTVLSTNCPVGVKWYWLNTVYYPPTNRIYVFGGYSAITGGFTDIYYFDLSTNSWSNSTGQWNALASHHAYLGTATYIPEMDRIYIISASGAAVKIYDPKTSTITPILNTPVSACQSGFWASTITLNNRLQRFGGTTSGVNCKTDEIYGLPSIISVPHQDKVDLVRFTQNYEYMEYQVNQGLVMKSNADTLDFFLDSTFNKVDALNSATNCYSFQSIRFPDQYIGHNLVSHGESVLLYVADSIHIDGVTWCDIDALNGNGGVTWVPFGYTQHYMRKKPETNAIIVAQDDATPGFKDDVSFHMWQFDPIAF